MRAVRRILPMVVMLAPLFGLGLLTYRVVGRFLELAKVSSKPLIGEEIRKITGHELTIDDYKITGAYAHVYGVRMARGSTFAASGGKSLATAREVILDFDLARILLEKNPRIPMFSHLIVIDPTAYISRDKNGTWNFMDLFKKGAKPPPRPAIGTISFVNGRITYEDAAGFHNPNRQRSPFRAEFQGLRGHVDFFFDHSVSWTAAAQETTGIAGSIAILGSYVPGPEQIYMHINSDRVAARLVGPLMPPIVNLTSGYVAGEVSLLRHLDAQRKEVFDLEARSTIHDVTAKLSTFSQPFTGISGEASVTYPTVTAKLDADFIGSRLHTEGTILNLTSPTFHGWASGSGLQLNRVLAAMDLQDRYPALKGLTASADVRASYAGTQQNLAISAHGPAQVSGALPGGARVPRTGGVQVQFSGSLSSPRFTLTGTLPEVRYREYSARNVALAAVYTGAKAAADFSAVVSGGTIAGRAAVTPSGGKTAYALSVRARRMNLAQLPQIGPRAIGGIASADVTARGQLDKRIPDGSAIVQVSGFKFDTYRAQDLQASIASAGGSIRLQPLVIRDPAGYVVADGSVDMARRKIDLRVEADEVKLARIPLPAQMRSTDVRGYAYLRDGRIAGPLSDPTFSGAARAYNIGVGNRLQLDYLTVRASGNRELLHITEGQAWRFPGFANATGVIRNPLGNRAQIDMAGTFGRVDLEDIASMAGTDIRASGTTRGSFMVEGYVARPVISADDVEVESPSVAGIALDSLKTSLVFDAARSPGVLEARDFEVDYSRTGTAKPPDVHVTGNASIDTDRNFTLAATARNVDLKLLQPFVSDYAELSGTGEITARDVKGSLKDGKLDDLSGVVVADTHGLRLNSVDPGDLVARMDLHADSVTGWVHPATASASGTTPANVAAVPGVHIDSFKYTYGSPREKPALVAEAGIVALGLQKLRTAVQNSPYLAAHPDNPVADMMKSAASPFEGTISARIHAAGAPDNPDVKLVWTGDKMVVANQQIEDFHGTVSLNRRVVVLSDALLRADPTVVIADGSMVPGGTIEGDLSVNNLPLQVLRKWFPARTELSQLTGTVNEIDVRAAGQTSDPNVTATFDMQNIRWIDPNPKHPAIEINLPRVSTSPITIASGKLSVADIGIQIQEPVRPVGLKAPTTSKSQPSLTAAEPRTGTPESAGRNIESAQMAPPPIYTVRGSGSVDFSWHAPYISEGSRGSFEIHMKDQGLGLLTAALPKVNMTLDGTIKDASLAYEGRLGEILGRPEGADAGAGPPPRITGSIDVSADRIASPGLATQIRGLAARIIFDGSTLRADTLSARTQIVTQRTASPLSDPITISGALGISNPDRAPGLAISMPRVLLAASPLPMFASGGVFGEVTTTDARTKTQSPLTVKGTLFNPTIAGTVYVQNTLFRLPSTFQIAPGPPIAFPLLPSFDLKVVGGNNVHVSGGQPGVQFNVYVTTSPSEPIHVVGPIDDPQITGTMVVTRGTFALPTMRFNVVRGGTVALRYPYYPLGTPNEKSFVAVVNVDAAANVTATSVAGMTRRYTVTVEARGPINGAEPLQVGADEENPFAVAGLHLTFRSDPPDLATSPEALQQRMIGMLGGQQALSQLFNPGANIGQALAGQFTDILSASLLPQLFEQSGIARSLGLEEFQIGYNRLDAFTLQISRNLFGPFYISYWRRLSGANLAGDPERAAWELKFSYRIRSNLQLSYTADEQHQNAYLLEGVFSF